MEANDPGAINELACYYVCGRGGVQQDHAKSTELHVKAAELGSSMAHYLLAGNYYDGGDLKKSPITMGPRLWEDMNWHDVHWVHGL